MSKIFEFKNVNFSYDEFSIKDVSLSLENGYIMGLVGRNGAGKTTLFNLLSCQLKNYKGEILINGYNCRDSRQYIMDNVAFISENQPFFMDDNVLNNGEYLGVYYTNWDMLKFKDYLKQFEVPQYTMIKDLSKGTFIKFQLAFALAHKPILYALDEPTAGLDPVFRREFLTLLQTIIENEDASVLFSTHITSDLDKIADYITMIDDGKILFTKDIEELRNEFEGANFHINQLFRKEV